MEYRKLGRSGLQVSPVCMGTMTFGREADEGMSFKLMDRYIELGGNVIDTADVYAAGASEEVVGRWLKKRGNRDRVVLATKVFGMTGPGPNDKGLSRLHIQQAVEASLRRLQTDVIDLYQIHRWDPDVPVEETLGALDDLIQQGKVRYVGCSNLAAWHLAEFLAAAERNGWAYFVSVQPIFNALNRGIETELLPYCAYKGLGVIPYNPLAGGMLTGKYRREGDLPKGARLEAFGSYYDRYFTERALDVVEQFCVKAADMGVTPAQLALAWVLGDSRVTCPLLGARNLDQLNDTIGGLDIQLTAEQRSEIPAIDVGDWVGVDPVYNREKLSFQ